MIELTRTNDPVLLSWLVCHLEAAGVESMIFDTHTSILEGSIGAIPRRVMVLAEQEAHARRILELAPSIDDGADMACESAEESVDENSGLEIWSPDPVKS